MTALGALHSRRRWCGALSVLCLLSCGRSALAQESDPAEPESRANYAFASQLGAGIYTFSGGRLQAYRLSGGFDLRSVAVDGWGLRIHIPATIGLYDFELAEVLESGLPVRLGTLAVVPELRVELPVTENWDVMPFVGIGLGRDFFEDQFNYIVALGTRSLAKFEVGRVDAYVGNRLFYSAYTTSAWAFGDDFAGLDSGLDLRHPLGFSLWGHQVDGGLLGMTYLYALSPQLVRFDGQPLSIDVQWEVGITIGTTTPLRVLGFALPRLGISSRRGGGVSTFRIVMGGPFT